MINPIILKNLNIYKSDILVVDIETSAHYPSGMEVNIRSNFDDYVTHAKVKWFGAYSYKTKRQYYLNVATQREEIFELLNTHTTLVGFNIEDFDYPIIVSNCLTPMNKQYNIVDCMVILGTRNQKTKSGYAFKGRGELMGYSFKSNSLRCMADVMELSLKKGDIDYSIFHKDSWTKEETFQIVEYLSSDILCTKQMFDKLWDYWLPFAEFVDEKFVYNLSWLKNSIASLTYKSACKVLQVEPTYSEGKSSSEQMGGNVITPKYEELTGVYYVDVTSLYPHIFSMFNLNAEVSKGSINDSMKVWHGNDVFKVKGYYDISKQHLLAKYIAEKLKERITLKETDPKNPMVYSLKILLNSLYGVIRSALFEKIHTPNAGWDCCWLGQQIQQLMQDMFVSFGFEVVAGDTDSLMVKPIDEKYNSIEYVKDCLHKIVSKIKDNAPFPADTFEIKIEHYLEYIMFPFSEQPLVEEEVRQKLNKELIDGYVESFEEIVTKTGKIKAGKKILTDTETGLVVKKGSSWVKERRGKKKNYLYIYKDGGKNVIELIGLPIKKDNATPLGLKIYNEVLKERIILNERAKFPKDFIDSIVNNYLQKEEVIKSLAVEYRVQRLDGYKNPNQIQAQISREYFQGDRGTICLIKNNKIGKVGKGTKYCTIKEALENKLTVEDFDLEKVYNELEPFIMYE